MNTNSMIAFLVIALVAGLILVAVVDGASKRGRGGRRGGSNYRGGSNRPPVARLDRDQMAARWATIQAMAAGGGNGLRQAVSEADKLFDQAMRQSGLSGDTMGERLKSARGRFSDHSVYDGVWRAHKLRNALAHEVGFDLVPSQAREALSDFERGLRTLGVL
jgi:hypothetical protein